MHATVSGPLRVDPACGIAENPRVDEPLSEMGCCSGTLGLVVLATALLAALPAVAGARSKPRMRHVSLLYVVNAGCGTLAPRRAGRFTLTLRSLEPSGVWFSDIGGDGTMLRTVDLVAATEIPVLGVNVGNLGYLAGGCGGVRGCGRGA